MQGVFHPRSFLLHLDLGGRTYLDHRRTAGQLGQAPLQLLAVTIRGALLDLRSDLGDAPFDVLLRARPTDEGGTR